MSGTNSEKRFLATLNFPDHDTQNNATPPDISWIIITTTFDRRITLMVIRMPTYVIGLGCLFLSSGCFGEKTKVEPVAVLKGKVIVTKHNLRSVKSGKWLGQLWLPGSLYGPGSPVPAIYLRLTYLDSSKTTSSDVDADIELYNSDRTHVFTSHSTPFLRKNIARDDTVEDSVQDDGADKVEKAPPADSCWEAAFVDEVWRNMKINPDPNPDYLPEGRWYYAVKLQIGDDDALLFPPIPFEIRKSRR